MNKFMMHQAQKLQERLARAQQELADMTIEGSAGGGVVAVTITGHQKVKAVKISPEVAASGDVEMLQDLVLAAISDALKKSRDLADEKLGAFTKGMNIPGM